MYYSGKMIFDFLKMLDFSMMVSVRGGEQNIKGKILFLGILFIEIQNISVSR